MPRCRHSWVLAVVLSTAGVAAAEGPTMAPAAKAQLDRGLERFKAKDYAASIAAFDAGYAIDPKPEFLYVKAQAQRLGGDCRTAIATYRAYLATHPPHDKVEYAAANIDRCEKQIAAEPAPAVQPEEPAPQPSPAPPAAPPESPPLVPSDAAPRSRWSDRTAWAIAGGGAVAIGVGAAFALLARGAANDATNAEDLFEWEAAHDTWARDRRVAQVATVVGLGLGVVAAVRFATAPAAGARVAVSHGGGMVMVEGRW
jgi:hypothetical protein